MSSGPAVGPGAYGPCRGGCGYSVLNRDSRYNCRHRGDPEGDIAGETDAEIGYSDPSGEWDLA